MHPLISCLDDIIPVNPHKQAEYKFPIILENLNSCKNDIKNENNSNNSNRFSLFVTSSRLAMMSYVIINDRL